MENNIIDFTFEQVMEEIDLILGHKNTVLRDNMINFYNFEQKLTKMVNTIQDVMNEAEEINSLGEEEIQIFVEGLIQFPFILLKVTDSKEFSEVEKSIKAILLLANNYLSLFESKSLTDAVTTTFNLLYMKNSFTHLIIVSESLLNKYSYVDANQNDYFSMSKNFVDAILNNN